MTKPLKPWMQKMPKWFWKIPFVWRFKYNFYHEQFLPPAPPKAAKTLPYVKYEVQEEGDIIWNPYDDSHFRCPHCGQGHELRFTYEAEDLRLKQDKMLQKVWLERYEHGQLVDTYEEGSERFKHFVCRMWNKMEIPCHGCRATAPKWRWVDAWKRPLLYFETENVCHCGGEMYYQQIPASDRFGLVCDKCNWVKPGAVISGSEGDE